ncbi:hypothetical protein M514_26753 [Trichuris suis]|uniref:Uncharacterized protein n=1 Tax=Trichuris suis TaxID=68888 RepID=A0A085MV05_9BILA|nr:hypothetical protein M514_26753 [Trichuris suis]
MVEFRDMEISFATYPMECICCAAAFPESMLVVRDVYDVSQSGVYDSLQNLQGVACYSNWPVYRTIGDVPFAFPYGYTEKGSSQF